MGIKRIVDTGFWTDESIIDDYSPEDKYFMLYLLTNPHTRQVGIYKVPRKIMAFETGYSTDSISVLLDRFENKYKVIKYSKKTQEVAILNYLKYSIIKGGTPVYDCIRKDLSLVSDTILIKLVYNHMKEYMSNHKKESYKVIINIIKEYDTYNDIHNDIHNDNDSIVPRIVNDTSIPPSPPKKKKSEKHKYGEFKHVLLTDIELEKLKDKFPDWENKIRNLDEWMQMKGIKYKDHYLTILKWARSDNDKGVTARIENPYKNKYTEEEYESHWDSLEDLERMEQK